MEFESSSLWQQFKNAIRKLLGLGSSDTAASAVLTYIAGARRAEFDVKLKLRFADQGTQNAQQSLNSKQKVLQSAIDAIQRRINEFQGRAQRLESKQAIAEFEVQKRKLETLFFANQTELGLVTFTQDAYEQVERLHNNLSAHLTRGTLTIPVLNEIHKYARSFRIVEDVMAEVLADPQMQQKYPDALRLLQQTQSMLLTIDRTYMHQVKELMVEKLLPYERVTEQEVRDEAEREFNREHAASIPAAIVTGKQP